MQCDMCGKDKDLFRALIEGTEMNVCRECSSFGKVLRKAMPAVIEKREMKAEAEEGPEIIQIIVQDCAARVKGAREKINLKQEELAKRINEKESLIHKIETGQYKPNLAVARKLEKFFNIKLVEEREIEKTGGKRETPSEGLTIGDLIKLKK